MKSALDKAQRASAARAPNTHALACECVRAVPTRAHATRSATLTDSTHGLRPSPRGGLQEWSDENVNDMIYYKKSNGTFTFQDLKGVLMGGRQPATRDAPGAGGAAK